MSKKTRRGSLRLSSIAALAPLAPLALLGPLFTILLLVATAPVAAQPVLSEIRIDQPGGDIDEYFELAGSPGESLAGLSYVVIGDGSPSAGSGVVEAAIDLGTSSLPASGLFVAAEGSFTLGVADLVVTLNFENSDNVTHLLVSGFLGSTGDDLDLDDDGVLDIVPWSEQLDCVALIETVGSGEQVYCPTRVGPDGSFVPAHAFRCPDGFEIGPFDPAAGIDTPGAANRCSDAVPRLEIFELQGSGDASPFAGQTISTADNVVTAIAPDGFFIQTPAVRSDGSVDTSDGVFVFTGVAPAVAVGDRVEVVGRVREFFGLTEIAGPPTVTVTGVAELPQPVIFDSATPSPDPASPSCAIELECYEGMLVDVAAGTVTGPNQRFGSDPLAEAHIVAASERSFREPGIERPGLPGLPVWDGNPEVFELDPDKLGLANVELAGGSRFSARGVLGFEFGGYELWPTRLEVDPAPLPRPVRQASRGEITVATLNLLRLFDDVDDPGPADDSQVVGAQVYARRLAKLALHVREVLGAPDILAVQEAEKLGVLEDLAASLAAADSTLDYTPLLLEGNDVGGIDVGYLVRDRIEVRSLAQFGKELTFDFGGTTFLVYDRPPLVLEAVLADDDGDDDDDEDDDDDWGEDDDEFRLTVIANHLRSLGGIDGSDGARVRAKRFEQALRLSELIQELQTGEPAIHLVVTGDFNAFESSDGFVDVIGQLSGNLDPAGALLPGIDVVEPDLTNRVLDLPPAERYSFVFRGSAQVLDHMLTSEALAGRVRGIAFGRGNADAPRILEDDDAIPLRASDHDGLVLYLDVTEQDGNDDDEDDEDEEDDDD